MSRSTYLLMADFERLEEWCEKVRILLGGHGPFLVGSVLERPDFRDVDLRTILPDKDFDRQFGRPRSPRWPLRVRYLNRALSIWGRAETGLPIDFQVQRMTEANAAYSGRRDAMGVRDWLTLRTSGVPEAAA